MADVVQKTNVFEWADDYLTYLLREWSSVPEIAAEWDTWDDYAQLDFVMEWPIREDRLQQLRQSADRGLLSPAQRRRYEKLLRLVDANRMLLEELFRD